METIAFDRPVPEIPDGASVMVGGFMGVGPPEPVIDEIVTEAEQVFPSNIPEMTIQ